MKTEEFKIEINAPASFVWQALWEDTNYRKWTTAFCEGSYVVSDWKKGSEVHFLSPSGDGMFSTITEMIPNVKMYFTHWGEIKQKNKQPITEETKSWSGSRENYNLSENNGITTVTVQMDIVEEYLDYFKKAFPNGLKLVKEIAENQKNNF